MSAPTDYEMIEWVDRGGYTLALGLATEDKGYWLVFSPGALVAFARGTTWRAAVAAAMERTINHGQV